MGKRFGIITVVILLMGGGIGYIPSWGKILAESATLQWTLPAIACTRDSYCDIRISPQGSLYTFHQITHKLYVSAANGVEYIEYDLSIIKNYLGYNLDFVPFDDDHSVVFFSSTGAFSSTLLRYNLTTQQISEFDPPSNENFVGCNRYTGLLYPPPMYISRLGLGSKFIACSMTSDNVIKVNVFGLDSRMVEQSVNFGAGTIDDNHLTPPWNSLLGGYDGNIYVESLGKPSYLSVLTSNLPEELPTRTHLIFKYSVDTENWDVNVIGELQMASTVFANPAIPSVISQMVGIDSDGQPYYFHLWRDSEGSHFELTHFATTYAVSERISDARLGISGVFLGMTTDEYVLFRNGAGLNNLRTAQIERFSINTMTFNTG